MAILLGLLAFIFAALLALAATLYFQAKRDFNTAKQETAYIKQQAQKALARYRGIGDLEKYKAELKAKVKQARALLPKFQSLAEMEQHREKLTSTLAELKLADSEWRERISAYDSTLATLVAQKDSVEETLDVQSFGFYRPRYGLTISRRLGERAVAAAGRHQPPRQVNGIVRYHVGSEVSEVVQVSFR